MLPILVHFSFLSLFLGTIFSNRDSLFRLIAVPRVNYEICDFYSFRGFGKACTYQIILPRLWFLNINKDAKKHTK